MTNTSAMSLARALGEGERVITIKELAAALGHAGEPIDDALRERLVSEMAAAGIDADFGGRLEETVRLRRIPVERLSHAAEPVVAGERAQTAPGVTAQAAEPEPVGTAKAARPVPPDTKPPAPHSQPQLGAKPAAQETGLDLEAQGDLIFWGVTLLISFVPAIGYELVPGGQFEDKGALFWTVYLTTLPWAGSLTVIFLMLRRKWLDNNPERAVAAAALLIGSAVLGWGFGSTQADLQFLSQVHGNGWAMLAQIVVYVVGTYAYLYGTVLWLAGIVAGGWAAHWLDQKLPK